MADTANSCDYCGGPRRGEGFLGRPWPDRAAQRYCCFGCLSLGEQERFEDLSPTPQPSLYRLVLKLGLAILVIGQSMILSLGIALSEDTPRDTQLWVHGALLASNLLVVLLLGRPLLEMAWSEWKARRLSLESLFLVTMTGAFLASLHAWITGRGAVYFEVLSVLLVIYTLGKTLGARTRAGAVASTRRWSSAIARCRIVEGNEPREIPVQEIQVGDLVEVRPGEAITIDGVIRQGRGNVSVSSLTGEPFAVVKQPGDSVEAGFISIDSLLRIEATRPGTERKVDSLIQAVEAARQQPISIQSLADTIVQVFLPLVVLIAAGTAIAWTVIADLSTGFVRAMSVLLVACPCAMGLATPVIVWSALARLAERGFVVRSGNVLERLANATEIAFDKTGTLTDNRFTLLECITPSTSDERQRVLNWLARVEEQSPHPVARAFSQIPKTDAPIRIESFTTVPGCGIAAQLIDESGHSHDIRIGRPEWLALHPDPEVPAIDRTQHRIDATIDGRWAATILLREKPRETVPELQAACRQLGLGFLVLTGDRRDRSHGWPEVHAELLPEDKQRLLQERRQAGQRTVMVGDGINDAPALATASVGIALASGTDAAEQAADVTLYHDDLRVIPWAVAVSRSTMKQVQRNLLIALLYNLLGVTLAALGYLHPVAAALIMLLSSTIVVWSSTRVGAEADRRCQAVEQSEGDRKWAAIIHALALVLQAILFTLLTIPSAAMAIGILIGTIVIAGALARIWYRCPEVSASWDMAWGMLTVGNLGMVLGWWADNGFQPFQDSAQCDCLQAIREGIFRPYMWVGMYLFSHFGMIYLARHRIEGVHRIAMLLGGNLGMGIGMLLGGGLATWAPWTDRMMMAGTSLLGMTTGMIVGMHFGTRWAEHLIPRLRWLRWLPKAID